jgi:hypothetical protein
MDDKMDPRPPFPSGFFSGRVLDGLRDLERIDSGLPVAPSNPGPDLAQCPVRYGRKEEALGDIHDPTTTTFVKSDGRTFPVASDMKSRSGSIAKLRADFSGNLPIVLVPAAAPETFE